MKASDLYDQSLESGSGDVQIIAQRAKDYLLRSLELNAQKGLFRYETQFVYVQSLSNDFLPQQNQILEEMKKLYEADGFIFQYTEDNVPFPDILGKKIIISWGLVDHFQKTLPKEKCVTPEVENSDNKERKKGFWRRIFGR